MAGKNTASSKLATCLQLLLQQQQSAGSFTPVCPERRSSVVEKLSQTAHVIKEPRFKSGSLMPTPVNSAWGIRKPRVYMLIESGLTVDQICYWLDTF